MVREIKKRSKTFIYEKVFLFFNIVGFLVILVELAMNLFHDSVCHTEGCKLVVQYVRFGDLSIILAGFVAFSILLLMSIFSLIEERENVFSQSILNPDNVTDFILIVALACEGFLVGYQVFRIHQLCAFCMVVFTFFVVLAALRILTGYKRVIIGFVCFAVIFGLFYLILPVTNNSSSICLPQDKQFVLFYDPDCLHCRRILEECQQCNIQVYSLPAKQYLSFLKSMGIEDVPVLFVNKKEEKEILVGENKIREYLQKKSKVFLNLRKFSDFLSTPVNAGTCSIEGSCK